MLAERSFRVHIAPLPRDYVYSTLPLPLTALCNNIVIACTDFVVSTLVFTGYKLADGIRTCTRGLIFYLIFFEVDLMMPRFLFT